MKRKLIILFIIILVIELAPVELVNSINISGNVAYADNSSEFKAAFTPYEGVVFDKTDNNQGYIQYWYSSKTYNMTITVNYESADGSGGGVFAATAHDKNNKVMFNISYNKG